MKKKHKNTVNITLYVIIAILMIASVFLIYSWYQAYYGENYKQALLSEGSDICATPQGYTDEAWREHMSHHPDRYGECLK